MNAVICISEELLNDNLKDVLIYSCVKNFNFVFHVESIYFILFSVHTTRNIFKEQFLNSNSTSRTIILNLTYVKTMYQIQIQLIGYILGNISNNSK